MLDDGVECCCRVHDADAVGLGMISPAVAHSSSSNDSCSSDDTGTQAADPANAVRPDGHAVQVADPLLLAMDRGWQSTHASDVLEPVLGLNVPVGQLAHADAPDPEEMRCNRSMHSAFMPV